jgi:hypothetical protein
MIKSCSYPFNGFYKYIWITFQTKFQAYNVNDYKHVYNLYYIICKAYEGKINHAKTSMELLVICSIL